MMAALSGSPMVAVFLLLLSLLGTALAQGNTVCSANSTKIQENTPPRFVVTTIYMAADVTVTIQNGQYADLFEINGTDLILKEPLDYEKVTVVVLILNCFKNSIPVAVIPLTVEVLNLNDEGPVFAQTEVTWNVTEDTKVNTVIGSLSATDADFDIVYYELSSTTADGTNHFRLPSTTSPSIQVSQALDYDRFTYVQLTLHARDTLDPNASISHTANATINVNILDVDNKNPWFQPCVFIDTANKICISDGYKTTVNRSEQAAGALVLNPGPLYAIDGDHGINEAISYRIISGNADDIFAIDSVTGNITMNKQADVLGVILLQAMASQVNDALKYALTPVEIKVIEKNNHPPQFQSTNYAGTVPAYSEIGSLVMEYSSSNKPLKIFAADADFPDLKNPAVAYSVQNSSEFTVSQDGFVQSNAELNSTMTIVVSVAATDTTNGDVATALISVEVTPVAGAATTTTAPTAVTTTTGIGSTTLTSTGLSSAQPPGPVSGTTKKPTETTTRSSQTGSSTSSITNRPPGPTTTKSSPQTTTVTTTSISGSPGKPATGNPLATTSLVTPPVPSLGPTKPTASSLPPGSGTTKPGKGTTTTRTGTTTTPSGTTKSSIPGTTKPAIPGTGPTTSTTPRTTTTPSGTIKPSVPGTGPTTSTTPRTTTTPSGTIKPSVPGTRPTTSTTARSSTSSAGGSAGPGTTKPSIPGTGNTTSSPGIATTKPSGTNGNTAGAGSTTSSGITTSSIPEPTTSGSLVGNSALKYSALDMAAVGASLAALLLICFAFLGFLIYKQYGYKFRKMSETDTDSTSRGFGDSTEGNTQLIDNEYLDIPNPDLNEAIPEIGALNLNFNSSETGTDWSSINGSTALRPPADNHVPVILPTTFTATDGLDGEGNSDSDKEMKSILTKERRVNDEGYKSVWFKGDIEPDEVVMINEQDGEGQGEEDDEDEDDDDDESDGGEDYQGGGASSYNRAHTVAFSTNNLTGDDQSINTIL